MKHLRRLALAALLVAGVAQAVEAFAGNGSYTCDNACPLAHQANNLRSYGGEAAGNDAGLLASSVRRNLARI
jgi:hypothetical protein